MVPFLSMLLVLASNNPIDHATYEAITGESADEGKIAWDNFYKQRTNAFGKEPISFLKEALPHLRKGLALVPAMGEGRNAIFLAKNGFEVEGNDISEVAVQKTLGEAKKAKAKIKASVLDINQFRFIENHYDLIVLCLYYEKSLISKFKKSLKVGGSVILYVKLDKQSNPKSIGPDDFTVKPGELKEALKDFKIKNYKEYKEQGIEVAAILAQKI